MKQILVMRKDLNMRKGKLIAQGAHASLKATLENLDHPSVKEWLSGAFTKIAVSICWYTVKFCFSCVSNQCCYKTSFFCFLHNFKQFFLTCNTCIAVGPASHEDLLPITGHLKLL